MHKPNAQCDLFTDLLPRPKTQESLLPANDWVPGIETARQAMVDSDHLMHLNQCTVKDMVVFLPPYQVPSDVFPKVKAAILGIGGVWNRNKQGYVFKSDPRDLFARICDGERIDLLKSFKRTSQYFPTPRPVIEMMLEFIWIGAEYRVLEPSAGTGSICDALLAEFRLDKYPWYLDVCELHPPFAKALCESGLNLVGMDFLEMLRPERGYNLIVANPPFSKNQDIAHAVKMFEMLTPGGRMVTMMSSGFQRSSTPQGKELNSWLQCAYHSVIDVEKDAFKESGTSVETKILVLDKPLHD